MSHGICRYSCLHFAYFNFLDKERGRAFHLLTSPRESRAGVKGSSPLPRPETLQHVEDMAKKLLINDEVAAVMRHCQRVSSSSEITSSNTSVALSCLCLFFCRTGVIQATYRLQCPLLFPVCHLVIDVSVRTCDKKQIWNVNYDWDQISAVV